MPPAQIYHYFEVNVKMKMLGKKTLYILKEFIFTYLKSLLIFEFI